MDFNILYPLRCSITISKIESALELEILEPAFAAR